MFTSALITGGIGPWLPFQMLAAAWVGFGAGSLPPASGRQRAVLLAGYGAVAALAYGMLTNFWFWPFVAGSTTTYSFVPGAGVAANLHRFLLFDLTTSMGFDLTRALTCAVLAPRARATGVGGSAPRLKAGRVRADNHLCRLIVGRPHGRATRIPS